MGYVSPTRDATVCHWCRKKFYLGQARYLVEDDIEAWPGWERVSICGLCWVDSNKPTDVRKLKCLGCGETIKVPLNWRTGPKSTFSQIIVGALCCSNRCHQRARRKHRLRWPQRCAVCKKQFEPTRSDAQHCSAELAVDGKFQWPILFFFREQGHETGTEIGDGDRGRLGGPL